jgi:uncharacterized membrane-anchored protein YjiN (DUF445 family)
VRAGQRVTVLLTEQKQTVGRFITDTIRRWAKTKMDRGQKQGSFFDKAV